MPRNNSDITREVEYIREIESYNKEIMDLRFKLYEADKRIARLELENETLRNDNLQLIEQIGGGE